MSRKGPFLAEGNGPFHAAVQARLFGLGRAFVAAAAMIAAVIAAVLALALMHGFHVIHHLLMHLMHHLATALMAGAAMFSALFLMRLHILSRGIGGLRRGGERSDGQAQSRDRDDCCRFHLFPS
jgi:hypothetical protein